MERRAWLAERRAALIAVYDAEAAAYGDDEHPWDMRDWVVRVLRLIRPGEAVLDAPCGATFRSWPGLMQCGASAVWATERRAA